MRFAIIIILFILVGCNSQTNVDSIKSGNDSINAELYEDLTSKIIKLKGDLKEEGGNIDLLHQIDSLQMFVIKYQGDAIKLEKAKTEINKFVEVNKEILDKIKDLRNKNEDLKIVNDSIKVALVKESESSRKFKKLNKLIPTLFTVKGYYHSRKLFGKSKLMETTDSKIIEYIEVSFTFGASDVISQKEYTVVTTLYDKTGLTGISKPMIFPYSGEEKTYIVTFHNDTIKFDKGLHKVILTVDSKTYNKSISLN